MSGKASAITVAKQLAIQQWLDSNPGYDWICFDDRKFTDDVRLIHIQREDGIDSGYYDQAKEILTAGS